MSNGYITLSLTDGSAATNLVGFTLANASFALNQTTAWQFNLPSGVTNVVLLQGQVYIATGIGAQMNGTLTMAIQPDGNSQHVPSFTLNNIIATSAELTWPTADGPVTQTLTPGEAMPMAGFDAS